jgi:hypothetical protein
LALEASTSSNKKYGTQQKGSHFDENCEDIRVQFFFLQEEQFARSKLVKLENNKRALFQLRGTNEWLGLRLEMIGTIVLSAGALFLVVLSSIRVDAHELYKT